jgi:hypothetical protein
MAEGALMSNVRHPDGTRKSDPTGQKKSNPGRLADKSESGHWVEHSTTDGNRMPPRGPANIIVRTPNPLPPPRDVESQ